MQRTVLSHFALAGLLWLGLSANIAAQTKPSLVGSWEFTAKPASSPSTAAPIGGLATFTSDGTVIETDTSEIALNLTAGHGIWQPSPVFGSWFIRFASLIANRDGTQHSKRIVTLTVMLNSTGDKFSGGYSFEVVDPTGRIIPTTSGTVEGQLMVHPLLP